MNPRRKEEGANKKRAAEEVRAVYAELAARPVQRHCTLRTECCQFLLTGKTPYLTAGEALVAAQALRASGRRSLPSRKDGACPLLDPVTKRCMIYRDRPFGCRTHFCADAGGPMARRDIADLVHRLEAASLLIGGQEARPLGSALETVLSTL